MTVSLKLILRRNIRVSLRAGNKRTITCECVHARAEWPCSRQRRHGELRANILRKVIECSGCRPHFGAISAYLQVIR